MKWIAANKQKPKLTKEFGTFESSEYVLGYYLPSRGVERPYEIVKFEKGEQWEQWYSPHYDDQVEHPDYWAILKAPIE
jgi:hypothetical protein